MREIIRGILQNKDLRKQFVIHALIGENVPKKEKPKGFWLRKKLFIEKNSGAIKPSSRNF